METPRAFSISAITCTLGFCTKSSSFTNHFLPRKAEEVGVRPRLNFPPSRKICLATASRPSLLSRDRFRRSNPPREPSSRLAPSRKIKSASRRMILRRGWDLNPRCPLRHAIFPRWCTRPLCDPSVAFKRYNE